MKTLFRIITLAAGLSVAGLPVMRAADEAPPPPNARNSPDAQSNRPERRGRRMGPARMLRHLTEVLGLTKEQQAKIKAIFQEEAAKRRAIWGDSSLSREDRRAKMMDLMKDRQAKIRAILTPEQQKKLDEMRPRGRRGPGAGPAGGPPPPPPPKNPPSDAGN